MVASGVPSFVRRGRREAVDLGDVLLAGEHQLGRGERLRELARLLRHPPGVDAREAPAEQDRGPDAGHICEGQRQLLARTPGQREMEQRQRGGAGDHEQAQRQRALRCERRRRDQHRGEEEQRERVLQPSREEEQRRQLRHVEGEQEGRGVVREAVARRVAHAKREVQPGRGRDEHEAGPERQLEAQPEMHARHRHALADDGEPAQAHQRVETQAPRASGQAVGFDGVHGEIGSVPGAVRTGVVGRLGLAGARFNGVVTC